MERTVTIPESEYNELKRDARWLACLENAGVDNWEGISFAHELMSEEDSE